MKNLTLTSRVLGELGLGLGVHVLALALSPKSLSTSLGVFTTRRYANPRLPDVYLRPEFFIVVSDLKKLYYMWFLCQEIAASTRLATEEPTARHQYEDKIQKEEVNNADTLYVIKYTCSAITERPNCSLR